jgi:ubiquinone/menaquinone biosynthesis C-methylase UbiE
MKIDNSFERYIKNGNDRYAYSISHLFGEVLDVGCGDGYGIYLMKKNKDITNIFGIDIQDEAIKLAKKNIPGAKVLKAEAENLPFENNSFDCVHCGQTLEHVKYDMKVIEEIKRVVRNRIVFSVPINGGLSEQHVRKYTEKQFTDLIGEYFKVVSKKLFADKHNRLVLIAEK